MNVKVFITWIVFTLISMGEALACEVCAKNQPKSLANITHGTGPEGNSDYIIIWSAVVIVTVTLALSVKFLVKPGEDLQEHVKNIVVEKF